MPFVCELATMVARSTRGEEAVYPVCETIQQDHVCNEVMVPARIDEALRDQAKRVARAAAAAADGLGVTGVEMFLLEDGQILVNELAPRPHNSGHYSIEACETSQFENHLRGILGLALGPPLLRAPSAAMVNILGTVNGPSRPGIAAALSVRGAHLHLYDKAEVRVRRKMGHVTALAGTPDEALEIAREPSSGWGCERPRRRRDGQRLRPAGDARRRRCPGRTRDRPRGPCRLRAPYPARDDRLWRRCRPKWAVGHHRGCRRCRAPARHARRGHRSSRSSGCRSRPPHSTASTRSLSIVQMPKGVPVATVAIDGGRNAGFWRRRSWPSATPRSPDACARRAAPSTRLRSTPTSGFRRPTRRAEPVRAART